MRRGTYAATRRGRLSAAALSPCLLVEAANLCVPPTPACYCHGGPEAPARHRIRRSGAAKAVRYVPAQGKTDFQDIFADPRLNGRNAWTDSRQFLKGDL